MVAKENTKKFFKTLEIEVLLLGKGKISLGGGCKKTNKK